MNTIPEKVAVATRGSKLALWQAEYVKSLLEYYYPGLEVELNKIKTSGDKITDVPLAKIGGKGLFVKEIDEAILDKSADLAVHSLKDVPGEIPGGLQFGAFPERGDFADCFLSENYRDLFELPGNAVVGTSSVRRQSQLKALRPDVEIHALRGNLDTRIRKLREGIFDAIIVAAAGLKRLGLGAKYEYRLVPPEFLPGVGQGALGIEVREDNAQIRELLSRLDHQPTRYAVDTERSFLQRLQGSCQVPIGGKAWIRDDNKLEFHGLVSDLQGESIISSRGEDALENAAALGVRVADEILDRGGREILEEIYKLEQK
uniref:hydroxymethylbilane synthase n=1 Tax=uncultured organism TaxID=155900 RepID=M1P2M1_9ZZZZ|nr:porphobilinogen deaminase [uncultured organism]